jgi:hypothetical protein
MLSVIFKVAIVLLKRDPSTYQLVLGRSFPHADIFRGLQSHISKCNEVLLDAQGRKLQQDDDSNG